jgi:hypothetical protein
MDRHIRMSGLTRRAVLAAGAGAGVSLAGASWLRAGPTARRPLTRATFAPLRGAHFSLRDSDGVAVRARLDEVFDLAGGSSASDSFGLLLHGPRTPRLAQSIVRLHHPDAGAFRLLASPAGTGRRGQDYAIIVNRAAPARL